MAVAAVAAAARHLLACAAAAADVIEARTDDDLHWLIARQFAAAEVAARRNAADGGLGT